MRICFACPKILPLLGIRSDGAFGGAEVQIHQLARYLVKHGFDIDVLVSTSLPHRYIRQDGMRLIRCIRDSSAPGLGAKLLSRIMLLVGLLRSSADVYVATCAGPEVGILALFARLTGKKFVYRTAHELDCSGEYERGAGWRGRVFGFGLRTASAVVTQHEDHERMLRARGIAATIIQNGFAIVDSLPTGERKIDVLWVGRCEAWKNPALFLDLALALPSHRFVMICPPKPGLKALFESIRERALTIPNLLFIERVPFAESDRYYRDSKLLVGTSDAEGFPNTYIQACIAGTPIVSYKVDPGMFLHRSGAGLVSTGDFERLVQQTEYLLRDESAWRQHSRAARDYALRSHDIEVQGRQWSDLFLSLLRSRPRTVSAPQRTHVI